MHSPHHALCRANTSSSRGKCVSFEKVFACPPLVHDAGVFSRSSSTSSSSTMRATAIRNREGSRATSVRKSSCRQKAKPHPTHAQFTRNSKSPNNEPSRVWLCAACGSISELHRHYSSACPSENQIKLFCNRHADPDGVFLDFLRLKRGSKSQILRP